jgi:anaerobic ribonucleoside-triphosphate reductase
MENKELKKIKEQIIEIEEKMNDPELCFGTASTWTRITGYQRPVEAWNAGKKAEFLERIPYSI